MSNHEYSLLGGANRASVGRYLTLVASALSSAIVFVLLASIDIAARFGLSVNLPPIVLSVVGASTVFAVIYWVFDRHVWRLPYLDRMLRLPNVSGKWTCEGQAINRDGSPGTAWSATVVIHQTWDKIKVGLETSQSRSESVTAAIICDDEDGYRLLYNYRNQPNIDQVLLDRHFGSCEIAFAKDLKTATGEYFNGHGRYTFGTLKLSKT